MDRRVAIKSQFFLRNLLNPEELARFFSLVPDVCRLEAMAKEGQGLAGLEIFEDRWRMRVIPVDWGGGAAAILPDQCVQV